jgi:outer membrane protein assembly factor BamB
MPRDPQVVFVVGIKDRIVTLDDRTGTEVWRAELRSSEIVNIYWDGEALIAASSAEVWRLDPANGSIVWHNELRGMGRGLVRLATSRREGTSSSNDAATEQKRRDAAAGAASA